MSTKSRGLKVPEGVAIAVQGTAVTVTGPKGSLKREYDPEAIDLSVENGEVRTAVKGKVTRKTFAAANTLKAHVRNMFKGVQVGFEKKLTVYYAHFPVTVEVKGKEVLVKNFLGEKSARKAGIIGNAQVKVDKQEVTVTGLDRDGVGQTAANIIRATRITKRDVRVFQDGIYVVDSK